MALKITITTNGKPAVFSPVEIFRTMTGISVYLVGDWGGTKIDWVDSQQDWDKVLEHLEREGCVAFGLAGNLQWHLERIGDV